MGNCVRLAVTASLLLLILPAWLYADATITGKVVSGDGGEPVAGIRVRAIGINKVAYTNSKGVFKLNVPAGERQIQFGGIAFSDTTITVRDLKDGETRSIDVGMTPRSTLFNDVIVYGAFKRAEKVTETPAAVTAMNTDDIVHAARGNQLGRALEGLNGVDVTQNGATDFNVNTRGFNNSTNRRLLVLVDGRDVALQQIGATEWNSFASSLDDFSRIELIRGPAAALYGANAFNGVLNLTTLSPREAIGTRISVLAGDYATLRTDVRHAGAWDKLAYKITLGHSQSKNLSRNRTDSASIVHEYPGLFPAGLEQNALTDDDLNTFATYGTARLDYDLTPTSTILGEVGYTQFGNEVMMAGAGRIHVPKSEKPFARLAFHETHFHVQAAYNARRTIDTMRILAAPPGTIILDDSYDLNLDAQYADTISSSLNYVVGGQIQHMSVGSKGTVFPNDPITANIGGIYGQLEYNIAQPLSVILSARYDNSSIYPQQFSPRAAVVFTPVTGHQLRLSAGRSFQRANFSELYRRYGFRPVFNAQGAPVNFRPVQQRINDTLTALTGTQQNVDLSLFDPSVTNPRDPRAIQPTAIGIGNPDLKVEQNVGLELGYKGTISKQLFVTVDVYYNRMRDFISGFLPGVNENYKTWSSSSSLSPDLQQYAQLVDSLVYQQISQFDRARFTTMDGKPMFVVSNTNIGLVEQYGMEIAAEYALTRELHFNANYSYYGFRLVEAETPNPFLPKGDLLLSPNTSPHRVNVGASYKQDGLFDVSVTFRYVDGFPWLAGDFRGYVPAYALVNVNAGVEIMQGLRAGLYIYNVLDRKHYEIFGGTIMPRLANVSLQYTF